MGAAISLMFPIVISFIKGDTWSLLDRAAPQRDAAGLARWWHAPGEGSYRWLCTTPNDGFGTALVHRLAVWHGVIEYEERELPRWVGPIPPALPPDHTEHVENAWDVAIGWPMLSHRGVFIEDPKPHRVHGAALVPGVGLGMSRLGGVQRVMIPLTPIWTGLIINAVLYAGAVFLFGSALRRARSVRRMRRGCCPGCGYNLEGVVVCPECGRRVSD
ncbi:MAG: hypothetical protein RIB60_06695 [Phycisphaerales bacterium]